MSDKPLKQSFVDEWQSVADRAARMEDEITARIDFILRKMFSLFGNKLHYWYLDGAGEGEVGPLRKWMEDSEIHAIITEAKSNNTEEMTIIDKNGEEWTYEGILPTRWLFDENFENEIREGKEKFKQKEIERKSKLKQFSDAKKQEDKKLIEEAKKKLSKKELAALRRSL